MSKHTNTAKDVDRDSITTEVTHVQDWNGGSLHRIGGVDMVVLNGTYKEMGRQYGHLAKDKMIAALAGWKKIFIDTGVLDFESIHEVIGAPFYMSAPKFRKDLYAGMAETSGLSLEEVVVLDNWLFLCLLGRRAGCSSYVAWGSKTIDGTAYMGRNLDFPDWARDLVASTEVIAVMNPVGGDFGLAGFGIGGTVTAFDDMMNSEGLYLSFNNGVGSIGPVTYSNRFDMISYMGWMLRQYSTIEEFKVVFNSVHSNYPGLMGVSQPDRGVHFEMSPETYTANVTNEGGEYSLRANQFEDPSWGIPVLQGKTAWYSSTRTKAWLKALELNGADKIDETVLMEIMTRPMFNDDGTLTGTGWTVFEPPAKDPTAGDGGEGGDVNMYQVITHSAERMWWLRIPTHTGWLKIDFKEYFKGQS